jgi:hypothetical protein
MKIALDIFALVLERARKHHTVREALVERQWIIDIQFAGPLAIGPVMDQGAGCAALDDA